MKYMLSWFERPRGRLSNTRMPKSESLRSSVPGRLPPTSKSKRLLSAWEIGGGYMLVDCDDLLTVHKFCSMLPAFTFEARPVVPVEDAIRVELEAMAYRDGLKQ